MDDATPDLGFIEPYFLGPAAENDQFLESLLVEFLRDHVYWRRNFHPDDGFRIDAGARNRPEYLAFQAKVRAELYKLSAKLKHAVPFFHPRYVGHMTGDLLLPGVVAKLLTTLYNPNNVSEEAAPVTLEMELQVGEQLARMFGYSVDPDAEPCAWGHLTGGGTVANYEALWNFRSVKFYGIALQEGARACGLDPDGVGPGGKKLSECSRWELLNLSIDDTIALRRRMASALHGKVTPQEFHLFSQAVRKRRLEHLGTAGFFLEHRDIAPPQVLVSASAHYSWAKGMKALGLGTANLITVAVDDHMRMDPGHLEECLADALENEVPVLAVVGMLGTTEFGTVDPIHRIVEAREGWRARGCDFGIHVDGAWGGYLTSVFRRPDGSFHDREEVREGFAHFPSEVLYDAFRALPQADSITVDPHKLGYIPYPAGAFVARNREVVDFIAQEAAYVFDLGDAHDEVPRSQKLRNLGQYILEGSKPGAAAAAVHVTHSVIPLDSDGLGRLLKLTVRACEGFYDSVGTVRERWEDRVRLCVPFEPDSNLVCLALNPSGNTSLAVMNRFGREVFRRMKVDAGQPVQMKTFIGSYTSLLKENLPGSQADRILASLELDPSTFRLFPEDPRRESDHIFLLRHTLMNPWFLSGPGKGSYLDAYWAYLGEVVDEVLEEASYLG
ncbi:MAG: pyridoxal-dependent decarboxylase [Gemmatimonadota bacterium]|nr:pyridoxal-dependent decarboxylase [Gemmatimonadota bacterium]